MLDQDKIQRVNIEQVMQSSYIDYSMSVIVARALPDVRDGLKPVHRRILYGMERLNNTHNQPSRSVPVSSVRYSVSITHTVTHRYILPLPVWHKIGHCATVW